MNGPDPSAVHPVAGLPRVCFIRNTVRNPNIEIGEYTYYDDPEDAADFERNVLYHYPAIGDRLVIGRYCAIARGVKFIMNGGNHRLSGISTYPFHLFGAGWERVAPEPADLPCKGNTVIGNDVWLGYACVIMPGVRIGDGAIVAARSVVARDVAPYTVVVGNPALPVKQRFSAEKIAALLDLAWWNWDAERVTRNLEHIVAADVEALRRCR